MNKTSFVVLALWSSVSVFSATVFSRQNEDLDEQIFENSQSLTMKNELKKTNKKDEEALPPSSSFETESLKKENIILPTQPIFYPPKEE